MSFLIQKVGDEGTREPFIARLFFGILDLRDGVLALRSQGVNFAAGRDKFDELYNPVWTALNNVRRVTRELSNIVNEHEKKLARGDIVRFQTNAVEISESIDAKVHEKFAGLLTQGVVALKGLQQPLRFLGLEIGWFYQKPNKFTKGIEGLRSIGAHSLADYLHVVRSTWSEHFITLRDDVEHRGWTLPGFAYTLLPTRQVEMRHPTVAGLRVTEYTITSANRLILLVENMLVYAFASMLNGLNLPLIIREIPVESREPVNPKRFALDIPRTGVKAWEISYQEGRDFV